MISSLAINYFKSSIASVAKDPNFILKYTDWLNYQATSLPMPFLGFHLKARKQSKED